MDACVAQPATLRGVVLGWLDAGQGYRKPIHEHIVGRIPCFGGFNARNHVVTVEIAGTEDLFCSHHAAIIAMKIVNRNLDMCMKSFNEWTEALTPLQPAAPSYTEIQGMSFLYDESGVHETGEAGPPRLAEKTRIVGRFDPTSETVSIIVPQRLSRQYSDSAINTYITNVVLPDIQKTYKFRRHFVYK